MLLFKPQFFSSIKTYNRKLFADDLFAGLTVGVVALPLAMAFAIASGISPEKGLYTAIVAGFLISFFGGSKVQIGGPTGAFVVIISGIVAQYGYSGLVYTTLLAGGLLVILGLTRMGGVIKFIPVPVIAGFTSGIAVIIFSTQIKDFFGLQVQSLPADFFEKWSVLAAHFSTINLAAMAMGVLTILFIILFMRKWPRFPAMLAAMAATTILAMLLDLPVETVGSRFGNLPRTLPAPYIPHLSWVHFKTLISPAFTVAILAAIESLLSATVADGMTGERHRSNTELIAQGIGNIGSAIFGGIPATGAIARTATNIKCGGKTPVAGIVHAITLALILLLFAPLAKKIPMATLAGILVVVSYNMSEWQTFISLLKMPKSDVAVLLLTFFTTIFIDLTVAVQIGIVLAAILFIRRMIEVTNVGMITRELSDKTSAFADPNAIQDREVPGNVAVFEINGPFFFGAADKFKDVIHSLNRDATIVILRIRNVPAIDATGIHLLEELLRQYKKRGITLILSGVHAQPLMAIQKAGLLQEIGTQNVHGNIDDALNRAREILGLPLQPRPENFTPTVARDRL